MQRKGLWIGAAALIAIVAIFAIGLGIGRDTRIGTTYVAKQTCSCLFVAGRALGSCRADFEPAALRQLELHVADDAVRVSALGGLMSATAKFEPGFGCHPVD